MKMAINYEKVAWDTTKYVNPTNLNNMDNGIKAACDKVDAHDNEIAAINSNFNEILPFLFTPGTSGNTYDVNDLNAGIYYVSNKSSNLPVGHWGWILTLSDMPRKNNFVNSKLQIFFSVQNQTMYTRVCANAQWTDWIDK